MVSLGFRLAPTSCFYIRLFFAYTCPMGLAVGGYNDRPDWPKMGPSLLIATCLIFAIRTARWPAEFDEKFSESGLDKEIDYAAHLASRVLSVLTHRHEPIFPNKNVPWYQANDEDVPK